MHEVASHQHIETKPAIGLDMLNLDHFMNISLL